MYVNKYVIPLTVLGCVMTESHLYRSNAGNMHFLPDQTYAGNHCVLSSMRFNVLSAKMGAKMCWHMLAHITSLHGLTKKRKDNYWHEHPLLHLDSHVSGCKLRVESFES